MAHLTLLFMSGLLLLLFILVFAAVNLINTYLRAPDEQITSAADVSFWWVNGVTVGLTCLLLIPLVARGPRGQRGRDCVLLILAVALNVAAFAGFIWLVDWLNIPPEVFEALAA